MSRTTRALLLLSVLLLSLLRTGISDCLANDGPTKNDDTSSQYGVDGVCTEPSVDVNAPKPPNLYLYDKEESDVEEYVEKNATSVPWRQSDGTYTMVTFYLPYCDGCKKQKKPYQDLSRKVKELLPSKIKFRSLAVSCHSKTHKILCREDELILKFPTIRLYDGRGEPLPYVPLNHMHPFFVMNRLGISERASKNQPENELIELETKMLQQEYYFSAAQRNTKMLFALSMLLRSVYDRHKDVNKNKRDPPLPENVAEALLKFLQLLYQTLPTTTHVYATVHELLDNFIYIMNHQGWLTVILDEHTVVEEESDDGGEEAEKKQQFLTEKQYWDGIWDLLLTLVQGLSVWNEAAIMDETRISADDVRSALEQFAVHAGWSENGDEGNNDNHKWIELLSINKKSTYLQEADGENQHRALALWIGELRNQWDVYLAVKNNNDWLKAGWPLNKDCGVCWEKNKNKKNRASPFKWNEDAVYNYIRLEYSSSKLSPQELSSLHEQLYGAASSSI